ncbi:MAG: hypothetical protein OK439_02255 [Thaumarchaeota archaeon]|nr:hypothetical protein [Nitrososphaerota archaeon]
MKPKVAQTTLVVSICGEKKTIDAVRVSMVPEIENGKRCLLALHKSKHSEKLALAFAAKDLVALRAGLNTNLRLVASALKTIEVASGRTGAFTERLNRATQLRV